MEGSWQGPTWKGIFSGTMFGSCLFFNVRQNMKVILKESQFVENEAQLEVLPKFALTTLNNLHQQ